MRVHTTDAQVWWIALPDEIRPVRGLDLSQMQAGINEIFRFPQPPTPEEKGGASFLNGRLDDILITRLVVYNDGLSVTVPTKTDDAERVLGRALEFFFGLGVRPPVTPPVHFPVSTIVADFYNPIDYLFPRSLLEKISGAVTLKGQPALLTLATNSDPTLIDDPRWAGVNPTTFKIERRANTPYALNRYFSQANMATDDHLEILSEFEELAAVVYAAGVSGDGDYEG